MIDPCQNCSDDKYYCYSLGECYKNSDILVCKECESIFYMSDVINNEFCPKCGVSMMKGFNIKLESIIAVKSLNEESARIKAREEIKNYPMKMDIVYCMEL
jgi:hypothetical protein